MRYRGYTGKVEFDAGAGILHGEVVGIRDVVTFQGRTVEEVQRAFRESVDDYLAFCRRRGESPDKPGALSVFIRGVPRSSVRGGPCTLGRSKRLQGRARSCSKTRRTVAP